MHMTAYIDRMFDLKPCKGKMITATGDMFDIEGYGSLHLNIRTNGIIHQARLTRVAYVPKISYHLFSLRAAADAGHRYEGTSRGVTVFCKEGGEIIFPPDGQLNDVYASRLSPPHYANAVTAPENMPVPRSIDINTFHAAYGHAHEGLLHKTVKNV